MWFLVQENRADLTEIASALKKQLKKVFARFSWAFFLFDYEQ